MLHTFLDVYSNRMRQRDRRTPLICRYDMFVSLAWQATAKNKVTRSSTEDPPSGDQDETVQHTSSSKIDHRSNLVVQLSRWLDVAAVQRQCEILIGHSGTLVGCCTARAAGTQPWYIHIYVGGRIVKRVISKEGCLAVPHAGRLNLPGPSRVRGN